MTDMRSPFSPARHPAFLIIAAVVAFAAQANCATQAADDAPAASDAPASPESADWLVTPSFKYDVLCLLNVLTGDPYYLDYYQAEYDRLGPLLTEEARVALERIHRILKVEGGGIPSAMLTLNFSVVSDTTLAGMAARLDDPAEMRRGLEAAGYFSAGDWGRFIEVREDLKTVFAWLEAMDYPSTWRREILPGLSNAAIELQRGLPTPHPASEAERLTGVPQPAGPVTVYVLHFNQPHGIRITGKRYLTYEGWPLRIVLNDAIHELLHPPYRLDGAPDLARAVDALAADTFVMRRVENHDPSLGYNTLRGLIEEDVVQAVEQLLAEAAGIADDPRAKWRTSDEGIHVFAAALYHVLREKEWYDSGETIGDFLQRELTSGDLRPGRVRSAYEAFYGG